MFTLFIDESGCPGQFPTLNSPVQPLLVVAGIVLDTSHLAEVNRDSRAACEQLAAGARWQS